MNEIRISPNVAISESGFVFNASNGETFTSNPIAVEILNQLKSGKTREEITEYIMTNYEVDRDRIEQDLDDFLTQVRIFKLTEEQ